MTPHRRKKLPPIHPGEILNDEFLKPLQVTQYRLAKAIGVDPRRNSRGNPWTCRAGLDRIGRK